MLACIETLCKQQVRRGVGEGSSSSLLQFPGWTKPQQPRAGCLPVPPRIPTFIQKFGDWHSTTAQGALERKRLLETVSKKDEQNDSKNGSGHSPPVERATVCEAAVYGCVSHAILGRVRLQKHSHELQIESRPHIGCKDSG